MATTNPNALSDAEYAAYAAAMRPDSPGEVLFKQVGVPSAPQGLAVLAGGTPSWGAMPSGWLAQMAADIAGRGGIAVQQNGYDTTAAVPVAAGPAWAGPSPLPAYPRSGAHMTMPGSREAWEQGGIPPVMMQSDPYATAAYRTYTDPYGQIGVQPLIGFSSRYPHVLSGVPNGLYRHIGEFAQALPFTPLMQMMAMGMIPQMPMGTRPRAQGTGNNTTNTNKNNKQPNTQTPPFIGWARGGIAPAAETRGYVSPENQAWVNSLNSPVAAEGAVPNWWDPLIQPPSIEPVVNTAAPQAAPVSPVQNSGDFPNILPAVTEPVNQWFQNLLNPINQRLQDLLMPQQAPNSQVAPVPQVVPVPQIPTVIEAPAFSNIG